MLTIRQFSSTPSGLTAPAAEISFLWAELETVEVPVLWRLSCGGMRPTCVLVFSFSRGRRCRIIPRRSLWNGRTQLLEIETALRQALLAAPATAAISPRARLMAGVDDPAAGPPLLSGSAKADALVAEAEADFARLRFADAARALSQARQLEPHALRVLRLDARLAIDLERPGRAIEERYRALFLQAPRDEEAIRMIALLYALNDWAMTELDQRYLEENAVSHPELGLALGGYYRRREQFTDATRVLESLRSQSQHSAVQDAASAALVRTRAEERARTARGWGAATRKVQVAWPAAVTLVGVVLAVLAVTLGIRPAATTVPPAAAPAISTPEPAHPLRTPRITGGPDFKLDQFNFRSNGSAPVLNPVESPGTNPVSSADIKLAEAKQLLIQAHSEDQLHQARVLLQSAIDSKNPEAMTFYAVMCDQGLGGPVEVDAAEHYYRASARAGDAAAQYFLFSLLKRESKVRPIDESPQELESLLENAASRFPLAAEALSPEHAAEAPIYPGDDLWPADHNVVSYFQPHPRYPAAARYLGLSGQVRVDFIASREGNAVNAYAIASTSKIFEQEAVNAVKQWRFIPALKNGKKIDVHIQVPIIFSLDAPAG